MDDVLEIVVECFWNFKYKLAYWLQIINFLIDYLGNFVEVSFEHFKFFKEFSLWLCLHILPNVANSLFVFFFEFEFIVQSEWSACSSFYICYLWIMAIWAATAWWITRNLKSLNIGCPLFRTIIIFLKITWLFNDLRLSEWVTTSSRATLLARRARWCREKAINKLMILLNTHINLRMCWSETWPIISSQMNRCMFHIQLQKESGHVLNNWYEFVVSLIYQVLQLFLELCMCRNYLFSSLLISTSLFIHFFLKVFIVVVCSFILHFRFKNFLSFISVILLCLHIDLGLIQ